MKILFKRFIRLFRWDRDMGIWWNLGNILNKFISPFKRVSDWAVKSFQYSIFLWNRDVDWDYSSLLILMQYKIGRMRKHMFEHAHIVEYGKYSRQMLLAETMIQHLIDDDFAEDLYKAHDAKWGESTWSFEDIANSNNKRLLFHRSKVITDQDQIECDKEYRFIIDEEERRRVAAYESTFSFIAKNLRSWWD